MTRHTRELTFKECPAETPSHLLYQTCVDFKIKNEDGSFDSDTELKLHGSYDGYGKDFSYLKFYFERCSTSKLREIYSTSSSLTCISNSLFDQYATNVSVEVAIMDPFIDLNEPTYDFYATNTHRRILANQKLRRNS